MLNSKNMFSQLVGLHSRNKRVPNIGARELELLDVLWDAQSESTAQSIQEQLTSGSGGSCSITVNTVQSTLERLVKKELLGRRKQGRAFYYFAVVSKKEVISWLIRDIAADMSCGDTQLMVSGFMDFLTDQDPIMCQKLSKAFAQFEESS